MNWTTPKRKPRTKKDMIEYLCGHPRYHTMNSWNHSYSFSRCIKLFHITFPDGGIEDTAYSMLGVHDFMEESGFQYPLDEWQMSHRHLWQWGTNGRSGGYIVMYQGFVKPGQHQSYCTNCGQWNFTKVAPDAPPMEVEKASAVGNQCGRCGEAARVNYDTPPPEIGCWPGRGVYEDEVASRFEDHDKDSVAEVMELVWGFDEAVDDAIAAFIDYCKTHQVEAQEILVLKTIQMAVEV